ncbi:MAG: CYTH and CHAD domain-containing protein [Paracoccus sp. (in: a-proteobacteria)]|uniref:CYTH and CHAD domain-containing protein n=1 Tax=Paracoccus sp. TaxID=267 RepID=UPI0040585504
MEVELKLQVVDQADRLGGSALLPGKGQAVRQRSTYFDTADRALSAAGVSLRIRQAGMDRTQTVKSSATSSAGLFCRQEWERPAEGDLPQIDGETPVADLVDPSEPLMRVFRADVTRRIWNIRAGDSQIEAVLDRGDISAGDRRIPVCELELELKSGEAAPLFDLARKLDAVAPLRLAVLSKAERGHRLTQAQRGSIKARTVPLSRDMTAADALQAILQDCLTQFRLNEDLLLDSRAPEPLHQARVALRRMRSAFSIFKPLLGADQARNLRDRLGRLSKELGQARDLDVLMRRADPGPLHDRILREREAAYDHVTEVLQRPETRALMLDLVEWLNCGPWLTQSTIAEQRAQSARDFAAKALKRFRRKVKKKGRHLADLDDAARHELRKDAKKLRYATGFFRQLFDGKKERSRQKTFIGALKKVQDKLGTLNDLATAPELLDRLGLRGDPDSAVLLTRGRKKSLLSKAEGAHGDLIDARRYWK